MASRSRNALGWLLASALALVFPACGLQPGTTGITPEYAAFLDKLLNAADTTPHKGERTWEVHGEWDGQPHALTVFESVANDGAGHFAIEPTNATGDLQMELGPFLAQQKMRAGFFQRYRDFRIRGLAQFLENYQIETLPELLKVAGRDCVVMVAVRLGGTGHTYRVAADIETGLVLASREEDAQGQLIARMHYLSIDLAPDLSTQVWHVPSPEQVLDPARDLEPQIGFDGWVPKLMPEGYRIAEIRLVHDPVSRQPQVLWVMQDGVESLFFAHGGPGLAPVQPILGTAQQFVDDSPYAMTVFQAGPWSIAQGTWLERRVMAVGKVFEGELLALIESALP